MALGAHRAIPDKIRMEMPLPRPRSVICSPNHMRNMVPAVKLDSSHPENQNQGNHPVGSLQRQGNTQELEHCQAQGTVAGVLRDLATTCLTFFFELFKRWQNASEQLHDDRSRDMAANANTVKRDRAPPENILNKLKMPPCCPLKAAEAGLDQCQAQEYAPPLSEQQEPAAKRKRRRRSPYLNTVQLRQL